MKKLAIITISFLSSLFILFPVHAAEESLYGKTIVLDAGHGGIDPGTTMCGHITESDANLDIAERLETLLENAGANVVMTRIDDYYMTNEERYNIANGSNGDALVSIHLNGSEDISKNGTLGLYAKIKKDKAFTQVLHDYLFAVLGVPNLGITNFMSGVTLKSDMPATMQEAVYLSNEDECEMIGNGDGSRQQTIAQALFDGLNAWFGNTQTWSPPGKK